jgi:L,D-transpeptidase catalytic domain
VLKACQKKKSLFFFSEIMYLYTVFNCAYHTPFFGNNLKSFQRMTTARRLFNVSAFVVLSLNAGAAFGQDIDVLAKVTTTDNTGASKNISNTVPKTAEATIDNSWNRIDSRYKVCVDRLKEKAASLEAYAKANNYSADYVFLVDMSLPSGKKRFFVYNLKTSKMECSSLVSHGFGSTIKDSEDQLIFSNNNYSFKTSLGRYKIGASYNGTYGLAYKLYGLDSTNSKAFERAIVLHSDVHIPVEETYPGKIFQSAGCPAVTPSFLPVIGKYIKSSKKPILMWIYN